MKYKILAGNLTAHPNNHGTHLNNYIDNKEKIAKSICEELILHDQILIPIQDYFTACGLIYILGESNFISLLESNKIKFLRSRHRIAFMKARHLAGSLGLVTVGEHHPWSSPSDESIVLALNHLQTKISLKERKLLEKILIEKTDPVDINDYIKTIQRNASNAFEQLSMPNKNFNDFLGNTHGNTALATTWSNDPIDINDPIKAMLGLAIVNFETNLLKKYQCSSSSTTVNLSNFILSTANTSNRSQKLWSITELHKIPDLGKVVIEDKETFKKIIKITNSNDVTQFRQWFHENSALDAQEIQQEFVCLIDKEPWYKKTGGDIICSTAEVITGLAFGTLLGIAHTAFHKLLGVVKNKSPKYFINQLQKNIKL